MPSKATIATWAGVGLLVLVFLAMGGTKLLGAEMHVENFDRWGYPPWFMYVTGAAELTGAALLLLPRTRFFGAAALSGVMVGAVGTHLIHAEWGQLILPVVLGAIAVSLAWTHRPVTTARGNHATA